MLSRRLFIGLGASFVTGFARPARLHLAQARQADSQAGRLRSRPAGYAAAAPRPGLQRLGLDAGRDGFLYVPPGYRHGAASPLVVLFHGAGQRADVWQAMLPVADDLGLVLLAPESRRATWDRILGSFGADVAFIDDALGHAFGRCSIDPARIAFAGFSDGASYALTIGLTNGDFVTDIIALSPGFMDPAFLRGKPRVFVAHGTGDRILPVATTSRRIVPRLRELGYRVVYEEFEGGHRIVPEISARALAAFVGRA